MSAAPAAGQEISPEQAYQTLFDQVHSRAFFTKLAGYGIAPTTREEAVELLALANDLSVVEQQVTQKTAAADSYAQARSDLHALARANGIDLGVKQAQEAAVQDAARQLAGDPQLYGAVLTLKQLESQIYAGAA